MQFIYIFKEKQRQQVATYTERLVQSNLSFTAGGMLKNKVIAQRVLFPSMSHV